MRDLNNEINDVLAWSENVPQQFQEFVTFFQQLDNQMRAQETEKKEKAATTNTNTIP
jgi:chaperonin cofactor prefoldin